MRTLFTVATVSATVAMLGEIFLPDHHMIILLAAISVVVVWTAWYLLRREREVATNEAITDFVCRVYQRQHEQ